MAPIKEDFESNALSFWLPLLFFGSEIEEFESLQVLILSEMF